MDSTYTIGLLLVGLSAFFLASHWQQWREPDRPSNTNRRWHDYFVRTIRRRAVASSLVGMVGLTLMAFETVPRTPLSITAYLFCLMLMTCWILWLACVDFLAGRRFYEDQQLDQIASELRRSKRELTSKESSES